MKWRILLLALALTAIAPAAVKHPKAIQAAKPPKPRKAVKHASIKPMKHPPAKTAKHPAGAKVVKHKAPKVRKTKA